jgi:hypothetical protein
LNSIQDRYADLSNFLQTVGIGTLGVGDNTIQLSKYATGEARLSSSVRFDGIARALGGMWHGQFADPNAISAGSRPYGLTVFNTTKNRLETNIGTDAAPSWVSAARGLQDADIAAGAAIAYSKLALAGTIVNADISGSAAIAKSKLAALNIVDADVAAGAAISKSKLAALNIADADIAAGAAISKSKLAALNIANADVVAGAAIAVNKLAPGSDGQFLTTTGGAVVWGSVAGVWAGSYPALSADIADNAITSQKIVDNTIVNADISTSAAIVYSKLNLTGGVKDSDIAGGAAISKTKLAALNIVNSDIDPAANIAKSKLAALNIADADVVSNAAIQISKLAAVSPSGTAFPSPTYDGQRFTWVADPAGVVWEMRWRSAVSRWEFIGGPPLRVEREVDDGARTNTTWTEIPGNTMRLTVPFTGMYVLAFGGEVRETTDGPYYVGIGVGASATPNQSEVSPPTTYMKAGGSGGIPGWQAAVSRQLTISLTAGTILRMMDMVGAGGSLTLFHKWISLIPVST